MGTVPPPATVDVGAGAGPEGDLARDSPLKAFLATLLLYRVALAPAAVAGVLAGGGAATAELLVLALVCLLVTYNAVHAALLARPGRRWPPHGRRWSLIDLLAAHVLVALTVLTAHDLPPSLPQTAYWFYVRGSVAGVIALAGPRTTVAVLVLSPVTLAVVGGLADSGRTLRVPDQVAAVAADLAVTGLATFALLMTYRLLSRQVVADGLRLGRRLERADQQRQVHDTVLQALETILLRSRLDDVPAQDRLSSIEAVALEGVAELRRSLSSGGDPRRTTLRAALQHEVERAAANRLGVEFRFDVPRAADGSVPVEVVTAVVGGVREALTNIVRHAEAESAVLTVSVSGRSLVVQVQDDGRGFDPAVVPEGFGISQSIRSRIGSVGGRCTMVSGVGAGTTVTLRVPR